MAQVGVLLVDPDQALVDAIRQSLEGHPYDLRLAGSPAHALEAINEGTIETVLVNLGRGDVNGSLIADIAGRWPELPVVAITEPSGRIHGFKLRAAGAWDYLEPPGDLVPERLVTVIA